MALPASWGAGRVAFHPRGTAAYVINAKSHSIASFDYDAATGDFSAPEIVAYLAPPGLLGPGTCPGLHMTFHPKGHFAYVTTEPGAVVILSVSASERLTLVDDEQYTPFRVPDPLLVDPTGAFLLVGNRAAGLHVFRIDPSDGRLTQISPGLQRPSGG